MDENEIKYFLEAALLAAGRPLSIDQLQGLFDGRMTPDKSEVRKAITTLNDEYAERGIVVSEVASGFRCRTGAWMFVGRSALLHPIQRGIHRPALRVGISPRSS